MAFIIICFAVTPYGQYRCEAQEPVFLRRTLREKQGLPSNAVLTILETRSGMLWIATAGGLCRFDGKTVHTVRMPTDSTLIAQIKLIYSSTEDSSGSLWFGTQNGLLQYVPKTGAWERFTPEAGLPREYYFINTLCCDHEGTVWVGTRGGLMRISSGTRRYERVLSGPQGISVYQLHEDAHEQLWVGAWEQPPLSYHVPSGRWTRYSTQEIQPSQQKPPLYGNLPMRRHQPLHYPPQTSTQGTTLLNYHPARDRDGIIASPAHTITFALSAPLRLIPDHFPLRSEKSAPQETPKAQERLGEVHNATLRRTVPAPSAQVHALWQGGTETLLWEQDPDGTAWISVDQRSPDCPRTGLYRVSALAQALPTEPLVAGKIRAVLRDRSGIVWVATDGQGVVMLIPTPAERLGRHIALGNVKALLRDHQGRLWCGTSYGIFRTLAVRQDLRQDKGGAAQAIPTDTLAWRALPLCTSSEQRQQGYISVTDVQETPDGRIVCASSEGLFHYNPRRENFTLLPLTKASIGKGTPVKRIAIDARDSTWWMIVPQIGLVHCATNGHELQRWQGYAFNEPRNGTNISSRVIFSLYQDSRGDWWVATLNGLDKWNRTRGQFEHYTFTVPTAGSMAELQACTVVAQHTAQTLTGAGFGNGFVQWSPGGTSSSDTPFVPPVRRLPLQTTINDTRILGFAAADNRFWWTSYGNTVAWTNPDNGSSEEILPPPSPEEYTSPNGTDESIANTGVLREYSFAAYQQQQKQGKEWQELLFDYNGDALRIVPQRSWSYSDTARVLALAWYRNDSLMAGEPQEGDTLLCPMDASFSVEYAIISRIRPERHRLYYRLEGLEDQWTSAPNGEIRLLRYPKVQPGVYRLLVRTSAEHASGHNVFSHNTLVLTLIVPTPWYLLWYVKILFGASALTVLVLGIGSIERRRAERRSIRQLKEGQKAREQEQVRRMLTEFHLKTLQLQMNPHFLFNTLIILQEMTLDNAELAAEYLAIFADVMRQTLEQAEQHTVSVRDEMNLLERYIELERMRYEWKIEVVMTYYPAHDHEVWDTIFIPSFIIQPFVENALRHGVCPMLSSKAAVKRPAQISLTIYDDGDSLRCVIEDNGIGRAASGRFQAAQALKNLQLPHLSIATKVTAERLQLMQEVYNTHLTIHYDDLTGDDGTAAGTRVTVRIPYLRSVQHTGQQHTNHHAHQHTRHDASFSNNAVHTVAQESKESLYSPHNLHSTNGHGNNS